jgi:hypothetical protein
LWTYNFCCHVAKYKKVRSSDNNCSTIAGLNRLNNIDRLTGTRIPLLIRVWIAWRNICTRISLGWTLRRIDAWRIILRWWVVWRISLRIRWVIALGRNIILYKWSSIVLIHFFIIR